MKITLPPEIEESVISNASDALGYPINVTVDDAVVSNPQSREEFVSEKAVEWIIEKAKLRAITVRTAQVKADIEAEFKPSAK